MSRTHRSSKLPRENGEHEFRDEVIEPYDWRETAHGSPLKSSDGVLLREQDGRIALWRGVDVPRVVTAHGVHADPVRGQARNLFTAECLAPMVFGGLLAVPEEAVEPLLELFSRGPDVTVGKARSVRGHGRLTLERVSAADVFVGHERADISVLVVQSPVLLPRGTQDVAGAFSELAQKAGWGPVREVHVSVGVRFGWNRHGIGRVVGNTHRLEAAAVVLPGSVLALEAPLKGAGRALVVGLGGGKSQGFGALLPHPGIARSLYRELPELVTLSSKDKAATDARQLWELSVEGGPSASQIGHLIGRLRHGNAVEWLERQKQDRPARIWARWEKVHDRALTLAKATGDRKHAEHVLQLWQDMTIVHGGREERR